MTQLPTVLLSKGPGAHNAGVAAIEVPERIGPVKLLREIGAGAMGVVWLAHHEVLARDVAVKFLLVPGAAKDGESLDMFIAGARAAAAVRHPGLTAVFDAGAIAGVPYIVMEYVEGPTLADVLRASGPLSGAVARVVLAEVCAAVAELHDLDLVHRDIKPSNIMVSGDGHVVLTDFGLACQRPAGRGAGSDRVTVAGTPSYMAPEMYLGEVSSRSDIYAVGATAFELLCGRAPFEGSLEEVQGACTRGEVPLTVLTERSTPEGVVDAIERAMNKDSLYRPKSARRLAELLEQGFEKAKVGAATAEDVVTVAFPGARPAPASSPGTEEKKPSSGAVAGTTFDLIAARAEEKRRQEQPVPEPLRPPVFVPRPSKSGVVGPGAPERVPAQPVPMPASTAGPGSAPLSASIGITPRSPRPAPRVPIAWGTLVLLALLGGLLVSGTVWAVDALPHGTRYMTYALAEFLGAMEPGKEGAVIDGRQFNGQPVMFVRWIVRLVMLPIPFLIDAGLVMALYKRLAFRPAKQRAPQGTTPTLVCGWCGYDMAGLAAAACPECGHTLAPVPVGAPGERPPSRRWSPRIQAYVLSMLSAGVVLITVWIIMDFVMPRESVGNLNPVAAMGLVALVMGFPTLLTGLIVFHLCLRGTALLDGIARCGGCAAPVDSAGCPRCAGIATS